MFLQFLQFFNSNRRRLYVVEEKLQQSKVQFLLLNITPLVKFTLFSSTYSVTFVIFFILGFQSSVLHKLKNILNCHLKLNKENNWSYLIAYSPSIK